MSLLLEMADCSVDQCKNKARIRGRCDRHHAEWALSVPGGYKKLPRQSHIQGQSCAVEACERSARKREWCEVHYDRWRTHGSPTGGGPAPRKYSPGEVCEVDGCEREIEARGLCNKHYLTWRKRGDALGAKHRWRDERAFWQQNGHGYLLRYDPKSPHKSGQGCVYQHREVLGEHIGRPLRKGENVHHKNGNRADNRIENLELWISGQPAGQRVQDLVHWAREIIAEYGDLADTVLK